ncbi:MAG: hypothetical protein PHU14_09840 [Methylovulum sp.]|nr:hypothetical protein [Methylovulum sp.]
MKTQELISTVSTLSIDELMQFSEWFADFMADQWEKKLQSEHSEKPMNSECMAS